MEVILTQEIRKNESLGRDLERICTLVFLVQIEIPGEAKGK